MNVRLLSKRRLFVTSLWGSLRSTPPKTTAFFLRIKNYHTGGGNAGFGNNTDALGFKQMRAASRHKVILKGRGERESPLAII